MHINHSCTKARSKHEGNCLLYVTSVPSCLRGLDSLLLFGLIIVSYFLSASLSAQPPSHPPIEPPPTPKADAINKKLLRFIEDDAPVRGENENRDEANAFDYLVKFARDVSVEDFRQSARRDITFAQLLGPEAANYRGEVVHVEGRLKRVRDIGPTTGLKAEGIDHLYEGWIFSEIYREYSYCVLFTELPPDLPVAEQLDRRVTFDGFFFKIYRFGAGDGVRKAPLLVGRTVTTLIKPSQSTSVSPTAITGPKSETAKSEPSSSTITHDPPKPSVFKEMSQAVPILLTIGISLLSISAGMMIWLRISDSRTKSRIEKARGRSTNLPTPDLFHDPNPLDGSPSVN